ncbi:hypothetical protein ACHAWC_010537 [Mediolabrus comicus]
MSYALAFGARIIFPTATRRLTNRFRFKGTLKEATPLLISRMGNSQSQSSNDKEVVVDNDTEVVGRSGSGSFDSVDDKSPAASVVAEEPSVGDEKPEHMKVDIPDITSSFSSDMLRKQHSSYSPPSSNITPSVHYVFLVHGWLGNDLEMSYLAEAFDKTISGAHDVTVNDGDGVGVSSNDDNGQNLSPSKKRVKRSTSRATVAMENNNANDDVDEDDYHPEIIVHSVTCNVGKTHDGIRNGGTRLANEIIHFIQSDTMKRRPLSDDDDDDGKVCNVTYSLVGNSLGGLYSRFAISKIPYEIPMNTSNSDVDESSSSREHKIHLFPNIFCTTATPKLNSDLPIGAAAKVNAAAAKAVKRLSSFRIRRGSEMFPLQDEGEGSGEEEELECVIKNMCLQDEFLVPLRNFRQRIAYANAYGTDFQVPCQTAAFLNDKSGVGHFVVEARCMCNDGDGLEAKPDDDSMRKHSREGGEDSVAKYGKVQSFVVAVLRTEQQNQPQSPALETGEQSIASDELLQMSQSLDALGWTKVFVDMRDSIPVPGLRKPAFMCPNSLDDLIKQREENNDSAGEDNHDDANDKSRDVKATKSENCPILTSQDLYRSTAHADTINIPLGHTVMIANSKSEAYKQINLQGRPVMDKLAHDIVDDVLTFE